MEAWVCLFGPSHACFLQRSWLQPSSGRLETLLCWGAQQACCYSSLDFPTCWPWSPFYFHRVCYQSPLACSRIAKRLASNMRTCPNRAPTFFCSGDHRKHLSYRSANRILYSWVGTRNFHSRSSTTDSLLLISPTRFFIHRREHTNLQ